MIATLVSAVWLFAADPPGADGADLGFAEALYEEGDYYRAITEAKRFLYHAPDDPRAGDARLLVGRCYLAGEQWTAAIAALEPFVARGGDGPAARDAAFALADARLGAGQWSVAALEYARFGREYPDDARAGLADLRVGWARILSAEEVSRLDPARGARAFAAAARELERLPAGHPEAARARELAAGAHALAALPRRSPALAGSLSAVLPGAGQLYAGRAGDGLIAFLVNALFVGGTLESYRRGNHVASGILALFEIGWYTGNVYSAVNSAHRFNDDRRARAVRELRRRLWAGASPEEGGAVAVLGARF